MHYNQIIKRQTYLNINIIDIEKSLKLNIASKIKMIKY